MKPTELSDVDNWVALARQTKFDPVALASLLHLPLWAFERYVQAHAFRPPADWLRELRRWEAARLLTLGKSRKEVAFDLGYCSPSHFSNDFCHYFGCPPRQYLTILARQRTAQQWSDGGGPPPGYCAGEPAWALRILNNQFHNADYLRA